MMRPGAPNTSPVATTKNGTRKFADRFKGIVGGMRNKSNAGSTNTVSIAESNASYVLESQGHIQHVEDLLTDGQSFVDSLDKLLKHVNRLNGSSPKKIFNALPVPSMINKWRVKKKSNKVVAEYDSLLSRSDAAEQEMKILVDFSVNDCSALMIQSEHVQCRIRACIKFNEVQILALEPLVEQNLKVLDQLVAEHTSLQSMLNFSKEVIRLNEYQGGSYIPWGQRAVESPSAVKPFTAKAVERRYLRLSKLIEVVEECLKVELPRLNKMKSDLLHCTRSLSALRALSKKMAYYRSLIESPSTNESPRLAEPTICLEQQTNFTEAKDVKKEFFEGGVVKPQGSPRRESRTSVSSHNSL